MPHAQKPDFVFRRNGRVHLNRRGRQCSWLLAAEVCASTVVMVDTPCFEVVWRVLATHSIRQFPLHFPSRASPCAITFQLESSSGFSWSRNLIHFGTVLSISNWWRTWRFREVRPPAARCSNFWKCCSREQKHRRSQFSSSSGKVRWWSACCRSWRSIKIVQLNKIWSHRRFEFTFGISW